MASVAEAQKDPALRRFVLRKQPLQIGGRCLSLVIPDARDWIRRGDWTAERLRGGEPPYWVQIWPAATAMARQLVRHCVPGPATRSLDASAAAFTKGDKPLAGVRVLDLGCGLGVPGCVAALLGAQVTFADKSTDALAFACWNARQLSGSQQASHLLDWSRQRTPGSFDLVLLADVSYHATHHVPLLAHVTDCLTPNGVVLHTDPFRPASSRFLMELSTRMPTRTGELVVRAEEDATRVRVVAASASEAVLINWSRSFLPRESLPGKRSAEHGLDGLTETAHPKVTLVAKEAGGGCRKPDLSQVPPPVLP